MDDPESRQRAKDELAAKNRRLAIILALIAVAVYVIFVVGYL